MEHVLIEKLVNLRQYPVTLRFELPLNLSMASHPEVKVDVQDFKQTFRSNGLLLQGTLVEEISYQINERREKQEETLHFTYFIPSTDLIELNLLNFEVETIIEQFHYHLMKKGGQVFLYELVELQINLHEYHLEESSIYRLGEIQKQSGVFLQKIGEVENNFLKLYPIQLPGDYSLLVKISGTVEQVKTDMTEDGCILEFACHIQGEYVTVEQKVSTFFFQKNEYFFFPLKKDVSISATCVKPSIVLADISLEEDIKLMVLYQVALHFFQEREVDFYTGNPEAMPEGVQLKQIEVEQIGQRTTESQMIEEEINLSHLQIESVFATSGECTDLTIEEVQENLLISGSLKLTCLYVDQNGKECAYHWTRRVDQMLSSALRRGKWQVQAMVQIPKWEFDKGRVCLTVLVEYSAQCREKNQLQVLTGVPSELQEVITERFFVTEEIDVGQLSSTGEERVYLHRYATDILQINGQVQDWQARQVEGGWLIKGQGELVIYYLTKEGERHFCHTFQFYQYIPIKRIEAGSEIRIKPSMRLLDQEFLEDGSVVQIRYLVQLHYTIYEERTTDVVIDLKPEQERVRPVFQVGNVEERLEERIYLAEEGLLPLNRIKQIEDLQLDWRGYQVLLVAEGFRLEGELEAQVRYRNRLGRVKFQTVPVQVAVTKKIALEGENCQQVRIVPLIKGFDYRLTDHPQIDLAVSLELHYRVIGMLNTFCEETFP